MAFLRKTSSLNLFIVCVAVSRLLSFERDIKPVTPNASPEAQALLNFIYNISGQYTLTGQHNYPNAKSRNSQFAASYIGKTPVVFSTDWGFAKDGDKDSYLARPAIVEEIQRQHRLGSIITICWHAVPPTANEPISFSMQAGVSSRDSLASVQGQITDQQFKDLLTPGTKLYNHWCGQVDSIAFYLKKLQAAHIPVLWRPYHEMNGNWFWWGGRTGEFSTAALYRQLYHRLVNHHKLNNLIWIWSVDRPVKSEMNFTYYFPGIEFLDILSLDVYRKDFNQSYYDSLLILSQGKPLALAEVGNPPTLEILKNQPKWSFYSIWAGLVRSTIKKQLWELVHDAHILSLEDSVYWKFATPYRTVCGLPPFPWKDIKPDSVRVNFSGEWVFNEDKSVLDIFGVNAIPYKMKIAQKDNNLAIQKTYILEYTDDTITNDTLTLDGKAGSSEFMSFPRITKTTWSQNNDTLFLESKVILKRNGQDVESVTSETWSLNDKGTILTLKQYSRSFWGERKITLVYNKE
jgi:mannan endo-1,4-beta-mannosidase